jgi:D-sedoheptulose 7-phosphate isomerase
MIKDLIEALQRCDHKNIRTLVRFASETKSAGAAAYVIGNGGSAAIASHIAADWTVNAKLPTSALDNSATLTCLANDKGYDQGYAWQLATFGESDDLLIAISSSGKSKNILNAVTVAGQIGMRVVTLSGFAEDNLLRQMGHLNIYVNSIQYGVVECCHMAILHAVTDELVNAS